MIGPALQGAQLISNLGRIAPWVLSGASMIPGIPGAVNAAGRFLNQPAAPYNAGGGGMGGRRGTSGGRTDTKPTGSLRDYGTGYKEAELRAGAAAESFRPGAGFPGQQAAADRAYQSEASRIAQLTAQDPELQRYEAARAGAKTQEEMNAARDIGMQIWQQKYGNTPMGQPGGAVGVNNPLMQRTFGYQTGSAPGQQMGEPTLGPSPLVSQIDQSLNPASPNFIGGEGAPLMNFADPRFENMPPEKFQELLNQYTKR
jgi:hypothetical protein